MSKKEAVAIARERIDILMDLSIMKRKSFPEEARWHIGSMEAIARRTDFTLPGRIKRSYCKRCKTPYGNDTRVRTKKGKILLVTCGSCGDMRRIPYNG